MLAAKVRKVRVELHSRLINLGLAALVAVAVATVPVLMDGTLGTSIVPSASACSGQSGGGEC